MSPRFVEQYCIGCHNQKAKVGGLALDTLDLAKVSRNADVWEKVVRKLRAGLMPPPTASRRPEEPDRQAFASWLEDELDRAATLHPNAGRTETFHRLNRAEYRNAVRDILALDIDVATLLPSDTASFGFDNVAGGLKFSESLMERYLSAAQKISRAALGGRVPTVAQKYSVDPAFPQDGHLDGLPFGTRGGILVSHQFPLDAEYVFHLDVTNRGGALIDVFLDGVVVGSLKLDSERRDGMDVASQRYRDQFGGQKPEIRLSVKAGPHELGVAFVESPTLLPETRRRPFLSPVVSTPPQTTLKSLIITGPLGSTGVSDTPSRQRIFSCRPTSESTESACAKKIASTLARRAYRRPDTDDDVGVLLAAYTEGRREANFEVGIQAMIKQLLVSPQFLFRVETDRRSDAGGNYQLSDIELASRLSFFLWSSVPDDELLTLAARGKLKNVKTLERQVHRMVTDPRSVALTENFAGQWLELRNLDAMLPSVVLYPDFNDGLRHSLRRETELLFDSIVREDRAVLELLSADYTFLDERLAQHYGIPNVKGSHFRRVKLADVNRRGLLGHGSILAITSQPVRTSPVNRGKWILTNILGTPPPPPPPNVPALPDKQGAAATRMPSMRERMAQHRSNAVCASCHSIIDPLGFGLENFDALGRWREVDDLYVKIDASGAMPDGTKFDGVATLRAALLSQPERFVTAFTEKLLTYALGRGLDYYDMPAVRKIVREAAPSGSRMSSVILGIVRSQPFQMRRADVAVASL